MANIPNRLYSNFKRYNLVNNTLSRDIKDNPKDRITVEIGDSKQPDFKPQLKISRWDNEVNFSIRADEHPLATIDSEREKIKYITPNYEVHQYDKPDASNEGGFEFEWVLLSKPASNVLMATIQTKNLTFIKQTAFNERYRNGHSEHFGEEIVVTETDVKNLQGKSLVWGEERAIGSYAVYHKNRELINIKGGIEYKTGKAFHIYRPKATDANGNEIWCELNIDIDSKTLTVTIDQTWIDNAIYPVIVDPTFGFTTAGAFSRATNDNNAFFTAGTPASNGTVDSISAYLLESSGTSNFKGLVCTSSGGDPGTIITNGIGGAANITGSANWFTSTFSTPPSVTGSTQYHPGIVVLENLILTLYYDASSGNSDGDSSNSYASPQDPGATLEIDDLLSIYATYTEDVGGGDETINSRSLLLGVGI